MQGKRQTGGHGPSCFRQHDGRLSTVAINSICRRLKRRGGWSCLFRSSFPHSVISRRINSITRCICMPTKNYSSWKVGAELQQLNTRPVRTTATRGGVIARRDKSHEVPRHHENTLCGARKPTYRPCCLNATSSGSGARVRAT